MILLKSCPRCGGDLCGDYDGYGPFLSCLQCGLERSFPRVELQPLIIQADEEELEPVRQRRQARLPGRTRVGR